MAGGTAADARQTGSLMRGDFMAGGALDPGGRRSMEKPGELDESSFPGSWKA